MFSFATRWARRLGVTSIAVLSVLSTLALRSAPGEAAVSRPQAKLAPAAGALFGAYVDPDNRWVDNQSAEGEVTTFEQQIGRKLDIDQHYYSWTNQFPSGLEQWDLANGRTPLVTWQGTDLDTIISGSQDGMIRARADALAALNKPVFLRWGYEMNGNWSTWDGTHNNDTGATNGPDKFVLAWKHIHDIFEKQGATNVAWVWSVNNSDVPRQSWNHWTHYYPGDQYVDWVGVDGYNWGASQTWSSWNSFATLMQGVYTDYASRKPIMVSETGSAELGGDKATWIAQAEAAMKAQLPDIQALVYFDVNKETDWRANSSTPALTAYKTLAADAYFAGGAGSTGSTGTGSGSTGSTGTGSGSTGSGSGSGSTGSGSTSTGTRRPHHVQLTAVSASPDNLVAWTFVSFVINRKAEVSIRIIDEAGTVVRHRLNHATFTAGGWGVRWRGKGDDFKRVAQGRYTAKVVATDRLGHTVRQTATVDVV